MKKLVKTAGKIALGAGVAYLAIGEIAYEAFVNIDVKNFIKRKGLFVNPEKQKFWDECTLKHEDDQWYDDHPMAHTVIWSGRMQRDSYAKVYFAEEKTNKWAMVVHGYTDTPKTMVRQIRQYLEWGFNVCVPILVGHGMDKGRYTSMSFYDRFIVLDWLDYVIELNPDAEIVIHGVSMGAATTMMVTGEKIPENVKVAVADCGYTSAWEEFCSQAEAMFHISGGPIVEAVNIVSRLRGNFPFREASPIKAIVHSKTPTLFIHGDKDTFVPYYMMEPLYEACGAQDKDMLTIEGALHAVSAYKDPEKYFGKVKEFVGKYIEIK